MCCKSTVLFVLLFGLLFVPVFVVLATAVDRMSLCNLEGYPGETVETQITLEGDSEEERSGYWYTHYKEVEGDDDKMDITAWITTEPNDYTIKQGEIKIFTVKVKIPEDAKLGLWGATSKEADKEGHSEERRTYVIFKDAITGGNVYSGLLLPVSINILESPISPDPLVPIINFVKKNIVTIVLSIVIIILLVRPLLKRKKRVSKE